VRSTAKNLNLATALREHEKPTPHRAGIATLTGQESAAESEPESAANRTWITSRIGGSSPHRSGQGSAAGFIPRSLMIGSFSTTGPVSDGTRNRPLMALATLLVNVGQRIVGIIALVILIRRK
jgi:hypothetical protein